MNTALQTKTRSSIAFVQGSANRDSTLAWDDVRVFLALCRSRTLSDAGRLLGVDASTMSRRLRGLEAALAANLFERGRGGILATEAAERLLPVAEEMEHVMARFAGEAEAFEREVAGRVRIACPADAAQVLIAPLLPELLKRHPRLRIEITPGESVVDLARRDADLALRTARPAKGDLVMTRLFSIGWTVAASPALAAEVGAIRSWEDVPWIGGSQRLADTTPGRWYAANLGEVEPLLRTDSLTLQISSVATGLGVALIPDLSVAHYGLVPLALSRRLRASIKDLPEDDLFLVTHRALRGVPRVRAVWEFLLEKAPAHARAARR